MLGERLNLNYGHLTGCQRERVLLGGLKSAGQLCGDAGSVGEREETGLERACWSGSAQLDEQER